MNIPKLSVERPITTLMVFIAVLIFGAVSYFALPLDVLPDIELPTMTVITVYRGAAAADVEQDVTKILEKQLAGVPNLKKIKSKSKENVSFITLEFEFGTDLNEASNDARDAIDLVSYKLPDLADDPRIMKINSSMLPILMYSISAEDSKPALEKIIHDKIEDPLKKVSGVGSIITLAIPEREILIEVDPLKLKAYNLSIGMISQLLKTENITVPGGSVKTGAEDLFIRVPGEFESVDEISNMAITSMDGTVISLKDIATIKDTYKENDERTFSEGTSSAMMMVQKQSNANSVEVASKVSATMEKIREKLPTDVKVKMLINSSEIVTDSIDNLNQTIMFAVLFVVAVVFFFLRNWRASLIIILTIPFSLIFAFIFMNMMGFTLNIISEMALAITIGMVVDNAIVVFENITKHIERGARPDQASIFGASEMKTAISASTLTTIAVFLPLSLMSGLMGFMFSQLAYIATFTLVASLLSSLALTPMLSSILLKSAAKEKKPGKLFKLSEKLFNAFEGGYESLLAFTVKHRKVFALIVIAIFIFAMDEAKTVGSDYMPDMDSGDVMCVGELEVGVTADETYRIGKKILDIFHEEIPAADMRSEYVIAGQTDTGALTSSGFQEGKNIVTIIGKIKSPVFRDYKVTEISDRIDKRLAEIPELVKYRVKGGSLLQQGLFGVSRPVELEISGHDMDEIRKASEHFREKLAALPELSDVVTSADAGKLEIRVKIDREKASRIGVNAAMLALTVRQSLYGAEPGEYKEDGEEFKIRIRYPEEFRNNVEKLKGIMIPTLKGDLVPLSAVARIEEEMTQQTIERKSQQRIIYVKAGLAEGISLGEAVAATKAFLAKEDVPKDITVDLGGQYEDQQEAFGDLFKIAIISLILVYMIMASQFESLKYPFVIMFAVPLSIVGVIFAFKLSGLTLSIMTFLGIIMLLGIVVNNGIVLVDYANLLRGRGYSVINSAVSAGRSRFRPVMMTTLTTIMGMIPMAVSTGSGSEMWQPIGITVIGGLSVSTIITLLLIPCLYVMINFRTVKKERLQEVK